MKREVISVSRLFVALCAALMLACVAPARAQSAAQEPVPRKFSEYVNQFTSCNAGAHLDGLAIELQNDPDVSGYIVIYGPAGRDGSFWQRAAKATKNYIVMSRGIEESRIEAVYGGPYASQQELLTELWLVPKGAEPPPKTKYKPDIKVEGRFAEFDSWDGVGVGEIEGWSTSEEVALVGLSDLMRRREKALAYLVAYNGAESAPGAWRRIAERQAETLRENGVGDGRVQVLFGGYDKEAKVRLWILPPGAPPPVKGKRERRPERSAQIASLGNYQLKYEVDERWAFKGLADVLKADEQLTGCVVIRLAPADISDSDPEKPVDPDEPPPVDLVQLVERWKAELKKKYGIGEHRLIVMAVASSEDWPGGGLETWVVPPGAPLPDPSANDAPVEEEENPKEL